MDSQRMKDWTVLTLALGLMGLLLVITIGDFYVALEEKQVTKMRKAVQQNIGKFQIHFGRKSILIVDNNDENDNLIQELFVRVKKLVDEPVINTIGKQWIASELEKKKRK